MALQPLAANLQVEPELQELAEDDCWPVASAFAFAVLVVEPPFAPAACLAPSSLCETNASACSSAQPAYFLVLEFRSAAAWFQVPLQVALLPAA